MKDLVHYLVTSLVEKPDEVKIEEKTTDKILSYQIHVSHADLGKVIGKRGRTAKAMRLVVSTFAANQSKEVSLEILEPVSENEPTPS
ncbi:MAG: KH domain-containing protein [Myxococcota bacterium]